MYEVHSLGLLVIQCFLKNPKNCKGPKCLIKLCLFSLLQLILIILLYLIVNRGFHGWNGFGLRGDTEESDMKTLLLLLMAGWWQQVSPPWWRPPVAWVTGTVLGAHLSWRTCVLHGDGDVCVGALLTVDNKFVKYFWEVNKPTCSVGPHSLLSGPKSGHFFGEFVVVFLAPLHLL